MAAAILAQVTADPNICNSSQNFICDWVYDITDNERLAEIVDWVIERPFKVVVILIVAWILNRMVRRAIDGAVARLVRDRTPEPGRPEPEGPDEADGPLEALQIRARAKARALAQREERSKQRAQTLGTVLRSIASSVIFLMASLIALQEFDISVGPLIAGAGVVGIALGFGAQSIVRDFLAGIFMVIEDQYGVGDIVDLGEASGVVEEVSLRTTQLRDFEGTVWHVPNGEIRRVANKSQLWAKTVLDVEVAYDTDVDRAMQVIKETADTVWSDAIADATVLQEPEVLGVQAFGDSAVAIRLVLMTEPGEQFATAREVRRRIKQSFDREGIEIPFPQRVIWMRHEGEPAPTEPPR